MKTQPTIHYLAKDLLRPTDAITVNVIGAGGTGSRLMYELADVTATLHALDHPGLQVRLFDDDIVNDPNIGRQKFSPAEVGLPKAVAVINRINRYFGFNWEAVPERYGTTWVTENPNPMAMVTITCVDDVPSRKEVAKYFTTNLIRRNTHEYRPQYWMDCGNSRHSGQVLLSTVQKIEQPTSKNYQPVGYLPSIIEEYGDELVDDPALPSCSVRQAIASQDLFINREVACAAANLLWQLLHDGYTRYRGIFINTAEHRKIPVAIEAPEKKIKEITQTAA